MFKRRNKIAVSNITIAIHNGHWQNYNFSFRDTWNYCYMFTVSQFTLLYDRFGFLWLWKMFTIFFGSFFISKNRALNGSIFVIISHFNESNAPNHRAFFMGHFFLLFSSSSFPNETSRQMDVINIQHLLVQCWPNNFKMNIFSWIIFEVRWV